MADGSKVKGCLKFGCFGCVGLFALFLIVTVGLSAISLMQDKTTQVEEQRLAQEIPRPADLPMVAEDFGDPMSDIVQGFRLDGYGVDEPGRVVLDLSMGEFEIVPGPADQPAHVEAVYDTKRYKLEQSYETWGDEGWTYKVQFGSKSLFRMLGVHKGRQPKIRIVLPRDRPFILEANLRMGESRVELGGLWVLDARIDFGMGDHAVSFSEPLAAPMKGLTVKGSMGEVRVRQAGNASPERMEATHSMGALSVDLRGNWVRDAEIRVRGSMGEVEVRVPEGVRLDVKRASVGLGESNTRSLNNRPEPPEGAPTLTLDATGSMGELRISG